MAALTWLVANPAAGGGRAARLASSATRILTENDVSCRLVHPPTAAATREIAREAVESGARAVIACGGDGTVHGVIQELYGSVVPLGILPGGSGDDIAASLGFGAGSVAEMTGRLMRGLSAPSDRSVDVGLVRADDGEERVFLAVLSTGFDSSVNERANAMARLGGQRYNVAMLRELASFRALPYEVTVDGVRHEGAGMLVSVGNGPRFGGGMLVCPDAKMDDGLLDVLWLGEISTPGFLRVFPLVYRGTHVNHPAVRMLRGRELQISAPGQVAYADGERIGPLPVSVSVRPGALRVLDGQEPPRP